MPTRLLRRWSLKLLCLTWTTEKTSTIWRNQHFLQEAGIGEPNGTEPQDAAMIDQIAAQAMGVTATAEPAADAKDSNEGKAAEQGSPETEGDKIAADNRIS